LLRYLLSRSLNLAGAWFHIWPRAAWIAWTPAELTGRSASCRVIRDQACILEAWLCEAHEVPQVGKQAVSGGVVGVRVDHVSAVAVARP